VARKIILCRLAIAAKKTILSRRAIVTRKTIYTDWRSWT
jgi:hypothetical protein